MNFTNSSLCPLKHVPHYWNNESSMKKLYEPFPESVRLLPDDSKLTTWYELIRAHCLMNKNPTFSIDVLKYFFQWNNKSPSCLDTVVSFMIKLKIACPVDEFLCGFNEGWIVRAMKLPLSWVSKTFSILFLSSDPGDKASIVYLHVDALKEQGFSLIKNTPKERQIGRISELIEYHNILSEVFNLLLKWLLSVNLITVSSDAENIGVKVTPLTDNEICLFKITQTTEKLLIIIQDLEQKIKNARENAKKHSAEYNKTLAMYYLKLKKTFEIQLEKVLNNYSLIHLSDYLEQFHLDKQISEIFKNSMMAIKKTQRTKDKNIEDVAIISSVNDLKQVLDDINEIQLLLVQPMETQYDEDELEAEFNHLNLGINNAETSVLNSNIESSEDSTNVKRKSGGKRYGKTKTKKENMNCITDNVLL